MTSFGILGCLKFSFKIDDLDTIQNEYNFWTLQSSSSLFPFFPQIFSDVTYISIVWCLEKRNEFIKFFGCYTFFNCSIFGKKEQNKIHLFGCAFFNCLMFGKKVRIIKLKQNCLDDEFNNMKMIRSILFSMTIVRKLMMWDKKSLYNSEG